jgi:hypothetical protein
LVVRQNGFSRLVGFATPLARAIRRGAARYVDREPFAEAVGQKWRADDKHKSRIRPLHGQDERESTPHSIRQPCRGQFSFRPVIRQTPSPISLQQWSRMVLDGTWPTPG